MTLSLRNVAFDTSDPYELARFWSEVLHRPLDPEDVPGDPVASLPGDPTFYFERVPEPKTVKNRVHVCLHSPEDRDTEVERVLGLGAAIADDHRNDDGSGWVVLHDPEGNEFCVTGRERAH